MNDSDWLKQAAGALRDEHGGDPPAGVDTRSQILAALRQRERQRRRWAVVAVPLAAVFLFSSAWAASTGRLPRVFALLSPSPPTVSLPPASPPRPRAPSASLTASSTEAPYTPEAPHTPEAPDSTAPAAGASLAPGAAASGAAAGVGAGLAGASGVAVVAPGAGSPPGGAGPAVAGATGDSRPPAGAAGAAEAASPARSAAAPRATAAGSAVVGEPAPGGPTAPAASGARVESEEDRLYREAHQAHFVDRNPARALQAWDAYLGAQKTGRFATEATYNRALTLVRLGRTAEARRALEPFAQGRFGAYRQTEAQRLLDAL